MTIYFRVAGEPKAQPRPRAFAMNMGGGKYSARVFDAGTAEGWKSLIAVVARLHAPASPILGPVQLNAIFTFARPRKHFVSNNPAKPLRADAPYWHMKKPDRDNCEKALSDCLTQLGSYWHDDSQVCAGEVRKIYGSAPGVEVTIRSLPVEEII